MEFVNKDYINFSAEFCPVTFQYPSNSTINKKKFFFNDQPLHECWFNLNLSEHDAVIYFTYQDILDSASLEKLVDDAFLLVSKHNARASSREEARITNPEGMEGVFFEIGGPVASPLQFYLTDNKDHFIRGSLYYNGGTANDSLQVVTDHIRHDMMHIINTAKFN